MLLSAALIGSCFSSCKKDDGTPEPTEPTTEAKVKYIIASKPVASTGVADYLLTADDLTAGTVTTQGNGVEQDGTYRYYITHKNRFFSLLYGQGNPGAVTTYTVNGAGALEKASDFQTETVQVFNTVNDDLLLIKVPRSGANPVTMIRIDAAGSRIVETKTLDHVALAGNGERAHFTWAQQVGDKVFAPYMSIKGAAPDVFGTAYPDSSWVAVFSYPGLQLEKIIRDNRTSYIGAYFTNGLAVVENGDVYGFSPAAATASGALTSTKPSAIVRIKAGTTEFDQSYFFNVQAASGGHHIYKMQHVGGGKMLLQMYTAPNSTATTGAVKLAVADVNAQTFTWVTGAPADVKMSGVALDNLVATDGKTVHMGLNSDSEGAYVYSVDVTTAKATRGLKVEGGVITSIRKLTY